MPTSALPVAAKPIALGLPVKPAAAKPVALGPPVYAAAAKPAATALRPPEFVAAASLRQSATAKPVVQLPVPPLTAGETAMSGSAAVNGGSAGVLSGAGNGGSTGVSSKVGDTVLSTPSTADRDACGLRPVAVTVCKPLVCKVSDDIDTEIIHTSSV
ncbi:hypothetical protein SUGI_0842880 [Cryptomeria japonica]|nr:hypothetical protein SUGI_0842880 [Cryptomeria japonica]